MKDEQQVPPGIIKFKNEPVTWKEHRTGWGANYERWASIHLSHPEAEIETISVDNKEYSVGEHIKDCVNEISSFVWEASRQRWIVNYTDGTFQYGHQLRKLPPPSQPGKEELPMQKRYDILQNQDQQIGYTLGWADAIEWKENQPSQPVHVKEWVNAKKKLPKDYGEYDEPENFLVRVKGDDPRSGWIYAQYATAEEIKKIAKEEDGVVDWLNENANPSQPVQGKEDFEKMFSSIAQRFYLIGKQDALNDKYSIEALRTHVRNEIQDWIIPPQPHEQGKDESEEVKDTKELNKLISEGKELNVVKLHAELAALKSKPSEEEINAACQEYIGKWGTALPGSKEAMKNVTRRSAWNAAIQWLSSYKQKP